MMSKIVPKNKASGVDFCGTDDYQYIVRPNLGCYMRSTNFSVGQNLEVFSLHPLCQGGEYYLADEDGFFYILKGGNYRRVTNMNTGAGAVTFSLHPNCQGGDHYLSAFGCFCIIFKGRGVYHSVTDMSTDKDAIDYPLNASCKNGLYYWGVSNSNFLVKPRVEVDIQYSSCTDLRNNTGPVTYSFSASVVPFMPGGLAINKSPAFGQWALIKTFSNDSDSPMVGNQSITRKVGYDKNKLTSVEQNWKIRMSGSYQSGALTESIVKYQFSLQVEFGGIGVLTQEEIWTEATEVEECIHVALQPSSSMYVWQYQLGFGKDPVLFCRDMSFTDNPTPPQRVPLPRSE